MNDARNCNLFGLCSMVAEMLSCTSLCAVLNRTEQKPCFFLEVFVCCHKPECVSRYRTMRHQAICSAIPPHLSSLLRSRCLLLRFLMTSSVCRTGNTPQRHSSNSSSSGRGAAASMGNKAQPATATRPPPPTSEATAAASSSAAESATVLSSEEVRDLGVRVWQILTDGLQPFMQWDLQSSLGDLWKEVSSCSPARFSFNA